MPDQRNPHPDQTLSESQLPASSPLAPVTLNAPAVSDSRQTSYDANDREADLPVRERLGRFEVHGEIGRGGMGAVLRGRDPLLGRVLAIKVLLAGREGDADALRRFQEEAQIGGQLQHPGLVPVYELGTDGDGRPFFAMKLVNGQTLAALLKARPNPAENLPRFLTIFEQVCHALAYAHARGVIHRDLKPANVMVGTFGEVQVMDWGLAKVLSKTNRPVPDADPGKTSIHTMRTDSEGSESCAGAVMGTPAYMSPEQALGEIDHLDVRADVFGLGAILCEILTGQPPFTGPTVKAILDRAARGDLTDAFTRLEGCGADVELVRVAKKCLAAKPDDRPRDGSEVAAQVASYRASVEERLRKAELERAAAEVRAVEERRRRRVQLALAGALLMLMLLGGSGGWWLRHQHVERQQEQAHHEAELREEQLKNQAEEARHDAKLREQRLEREAELAKQESERARREAALVRAVEDDLNRLAAARRERKWDEAERVLERVEGRLGQNGVDHLQRQVSRARDDLARVRRDQQMDAKLEEAKLQYAGVGDKSMNTPEANRKRFELAFAWYELDVRQGSPEEVAVRLRDSAIREQLVIALDWWADFCEPEEAKRLRLIAQAADGSDWRRRLRGALLSNDADLIRRLADDPKVVEQPPATITYLAYVLLLANAPDRSIAVLREGRLRSPTNFWLNYDLAAALQNASSPQIAEAVRYYTAAQTLRPDSLFVLLNLGAALEAQNNLAEAEASYRQAIRLRPDFGRAHNWLGNVLMLQAKYDEAVIAYRETIRLEPNTPMHHCNYGIALQKQGKLPEAILAFRAAIRLKPDDPIAYCQLGSAFNAQGKLLDAATAYRAAIRLNPDDPLAHCNLAFILRQRSQFGASLDAFRRGHEVGARTPGWRSPSEQWVRDAERLVELERRLPDVLDGKAEPATAVEHIEFARVCDLKHLYAAAARFYAGAFEADASLADDMVQLHRYLAAWCAVLAATGKDEGTKPVDERARVRFRNQALGWMRADLAAWTKRLDGGKPEDRALVEMQMQYWQKNVDLAPVRDVDALAKLPEAERAAWRKLWQDVEILHQRAAERLR